MAIRYSQTINNIAGEYWKVDILDDDYVGSVLEFHLQDFQYQTKQLANRWDLIWGAEVQINCLSNAEFDLETLIDDIIEADEARFKIVLSKKSNIGDPFVFEWVGIVLNDLSGGTDSAPIQEFTIAAADGVGTLQGIDYKIDDTTAYGEKTVAAHLMDCLKMLPTSALFSASDVFLKHSIRYFESQMPSANGSPIEWTRIPGTAFYSIDENGVYTFKTCYEVIELCCQLFYSRLSFWNGCWRLYNVRDMETQTNQAVRAFQFDGTLVGGFVSETLRYSIDGTWNGSRLAGQSFSFLPPLRRVEQLHQHDSSRNLTEGFTFSTSDSIQTVVENVPIGIGEYFAVSGTLYFSASENPILVVQREVYIKVRLTFKVGNLRLRRLINSNSENDDYTAMTWATSGTNYVEYIGAFTMTVGGNFSMAIGFETPILLNVGLVDLDIQLEKFYIQDLQGNDLSGGYNYSANLFNLYLEYVDETPENERIYFAENATTSFLTEVVELPTAEIGDKRNGLTENRLKVWNGTSIVDSEGNWGRGSLLGTTPLLQFVINDIIKGQRKALRKRNGQFIGAFNVFNILLVSGDLYMPLSVTFSCNDAVFSGEWYKVGTYDDAGLNTGSVGVAIQNNQMPPSVFATASNTVVASNRGFQLPTATVETLLSLRNTQAGTMMFVSDAKSVVIYSGERWETMSGEPVEMVDTDENDAVDSDEDGGIVY